MYNADIPLISIIVPSFNHRSYIESLLDSIINQTYKNFEIIVVDDFSTDGSREYLRQNQLKYNYKLIENDYNLGVCETLNRGIEVSSGEFLVCIASDDEMPTYRLEEQLNFFKKDIELQVLGGAVENMDLDGNSMGIETPNKLGEIKLQDILLQNPVMAPTVMMRKSLFQKYGPYPKSIVIEDYYRWIQVSIRSEKILNTDKVWAKYRRDNSGNSIKKKLWYYKGALQCLHIFCDNSAVHTKVRALEFRFSILLGLKGNEALLLTSDATLKKIGMKFKVLSTLIFILPQFFKNYIFRCIKSNR